MKKLTNYQPGARGINLKDGTTQWVDPGQSVEIDPKDIAGELPDFGKVPSKDDADDNDLIASVQAENADLKAQVAAQAKELAELKKAAGK